MKIFVEIKNLKGRSRDERLENVITSVPGVWSVNVDDQSGWVDVECQPLHILEIASQLELAGYHVGSMGMTKSGAVACRGAGRNEAFTT